MFNVDFDISGGVAFVMGDLPPCTGCGSRIERAKAPGNEPSQSNWAPTLVHVVIHEVLLLHDSELCLSVLVNFMEVTTGAEEEWEWAYGGIGWISVWSLWSGLKG